MALPEVDLTNEDIAKAIQIQAVEVKKTIDIATATLTRKRQGWLREALAREGHTAATLRDQAMRCIFGFSSNNDVEGCSEVARFVCDDCEAICVNFTKRIADTRSTLAILLSLGSSRLCRSRKLGRRLLRKHLRTQNWQTRKKIKPRAKILGQI